MAKLWPHIAQVDELRAYFPDLKANQLPERDYMWAVVCTIAPDAARSLLEDARRLRAVGTKESFEDLVEIDPDVYEHIQRVLAQKSKLHSYNRSLWYSTLRKNTIFAEKIRQAHQHQEASKTIPS